MVIKATGAIEKIYSIDAGEDVFGTLVLHHWDERTGMQLDPLPGTFTLHPERKSTAFALTNGVAVHETIFVLSGEARRRPRRSAGGVLHGGAAQRRRRRGAGRHVRVLPAARPPAARHRGRVRRARARLRRPGTRARTPTTSASSAIDRTPASYETTLDHAKAIAAARAGHCSRTATDTPPADPLGVFHSSHALAPGASARIAYTADLLDPGPQGGREDVPGLPAGRRRAGAHPRALRRGAGPRGRADAGRRGQPRRAVGQGQYAAHRC